MTRGEINVDPIEGEFFSTEALGSISDALVREAVQNSLDAGLPGEPVHIVLSFSTSDKGLAPDAFHPYLETLAPHLFSKKTGLTELPELQGTTDILVLEDFGTRGLVGDEREDEDDGDMAPDEKNDFYYFWRNIGRAVEGTTARGRWGLGKTVFQAASRINSFFGLTIRRNDPRRLLMGQSVLKIHRLNGRKYAPYGYFGIFEGDFALPITDEIEITRFAMDFTLTRKDEPGLSIVIPFPDREILPQDIIRSAIHHYFFPILAGDLTMTIRHEGMEDVLDSGSIFTFLASSDWADRDLIARRLDLAKWCIECMEMSEESFTVLREPPEGRAPKWDEELFPEGALTNLRMRFDQGNRIALQVPLWIQPTGESFRHTFFRVVLERDPRAEHGEDFFIREGVTIAGISSLRQRGMRVLVPAYDPPLSRFLGDAENPAHTEWQERSPKFRGRYERGPSCLRFVKNSSREIVRILSRPPQGRDKTLLSDFFYLETPSPAKSDGPQPGGKENAETTVTKESPETPVLTIPGDRYLQMKRIKGGFRIFPHPDAGRLPKVVTLEMAYDVRRGNPFKKYRAFDFELNRPPIRLKGKGLTVTLKESNKLQIILEKKDFMLLVTGFDSHRDLRIKVRTSLDRKS